MSWHHSTDRWEVKTYECEMDRQHHGIRFLDLEPRDLRLVDDADIVEYDFLRANGHAILVDIIEHRHPPDGALSDWACESYDLTDYDLAELPEYVTTSLRADFDLRLGRVVDTTDGSPLPA